MSTEPTGATYDECGPIVVQLAATSLASREPIRAAD